MKNRLMARCSSLRTTSIRTTESVTYCAPRTDVGSDIGIWERSVRFASSTQPMRRLRRARLNPVGQKSRYFSVRLNFTTLTGGCNSSSLTSSIMPLSPVRPERFLETADQPQVLSMTNCPAHAGDLDLVAVISVIEHRLQVCASWRPSRQVNRLARGHSPHWSSHQVPRGVRGPRLGARECEQSTVSEAETAYALALRVKTMSEVRSMSLRPIFAVALSCLALLLTAAPPAQAETGRVTDPHGDFPDIWRLDYNNAQNKVVMTMKVASLADAQNESFYIQWGTAKKYQVFYSPSADITDLRFFRDADTFRSVACGGLRVTDDADANTTKAVVPRSCLPQAPDRLRFKGIATQGTSLSDGTSVSPFAARG